MVDKVYEMAGDIANRSRQIKSLSAAASCILVGDSFANPDTIQAILIDIFEVIEMLGDTSHEAASNIEAATNPERRGDRAPPDMAVKD
ncbi:MAG: hypothetical protein Q7T00_08400 [Rugosibacter sp.]|nr:hypothetical protein [Rugosibacter sp.]